MWIRLCIAWNKTCLLNNLSGGMHWIFTSHNYYNQFLAPENQWTPVSRRLQMNIPLLMRHMTRYVILNTHTIICALVVSRREKCFLPIFWFSLHCLKDLRFVKVDSFIDGCLVIKPIRLLTNVANCHNMFKHIASMILHVARMF